jgi:hypothetical protein
MTSETPKQKTYVGNGREVGKYGNIVISFALEDANKYAKKSKNGKHYLNLLIGKRQEPDKYGKTHYVAIDEWEVKTPEEKEAIKATEKELTEQYGPKQEEEFEEPSVQTGDDDEIDVKDIPF